MAHVTALNAIWIRLQNMIVLIMFMNNVKIPLCNTMDLFSLFLSMNSIHFLPHQQQGIRHHSAGTYTIYNNNYFFV